MSPAKLQPTDKACNARLVEPKSVARDRSVFTPKRKGLGSCSNAGRQKNCSTRMCHTLTLHTSPNLQKLHRLTRHSNRLTWQLRMSQRHNRCRPIPMFNTDELRLTGRKRRHVPPGRANASSVSTTSTQLVSAVRPPYLLLMREGMSSKLLGGGRSRPGWTVLMNTPPLRTSTSLRLLRVSRDRARASRCGDRSLPTAVLVS